jgi:hypothetical protein
MNARRELRLGVFPVLGALYPVLALAAGNAGAGASFGGFARAALGAAAVGIAAWGVSALATRDPDRRTLAALAAVVWFSGYGAWERAAWGTPPRPIVFLASLLLLAATVGWVARTRRGLATPARIARMTVALVLVFPLATLAMRPGHAVAGPGAAGTAAARPAADSLPSIYLIILDKYSGSRSLAAYHGFDNAPFESRLRRMGFTVGRAAAPNYPHTWLSLPSMLNWEPVDAILAGKPEREWMGALRASLDDNRTARFLRQRGYEYVFVPSTFPFTDGSTVADRVVAAPRRRGGLDLWAAWVAETPLRMIPARRAGGGAARPTPFPAQSAEEMRRKLEAIAATADGRRPRFVFAHLLLPHEPFVFRADCTPREPFWPASEAGAEGERAKAAYLEQVACANRLVERMVADILRRSRVPPVILLQADHGNGFITLETATGRQPPRAALAPGQLAERMDAFAAYHLPDGGEAALYPGMTAVNLVPAVLNHYLDARLPLREDRVWWATLHPPFGFERIR